MRSHPASWPCWLFAAWFVPAFGAGVDFSHEVVPILRQQCGECHAGDKKKGGFSMNTRSALLAGSENGAVLVPGQPDKTKLLELVTSADPDVRMPPKGPRLSPAEVGVLRAWIEQGAVWTEGFAFKQSAYEPSLRPRQPVLAPAADGRTHPIDRVLDAWLAARKLPRPVRADDATFLRRVSLDLVGLLPSPEETQRFLADPSADKRTRLVRALLARDVDYADHWMVFWNDLLRNDYAGTGYIDGGRKQITPWLYAALVSNKPYDEFVRELIVPTPASEGFAKGIVWRGAVSAGQVPELQFAQNVSQAFLGINMKCASCHDSFIDRWKLRDAYGLAAIYSDHPLELVRCDIPTGKFAVPGWPFPELGQIEANKPREERLRQLASLLTRPDNARFQRTMVNRLWHRLMGRGVVHPVDAMQSEPWSEDLLDVLANQFVAAGYDLRSALEFITTSEAYQSRSEVQSAGADEKGYLYRGPRAKRLTAEQFVDQVWRLTGTTPVKIDAAVVRAPGRVAPLPRASLVKSDLLQRALGRPNREQIVSMRPNELSTLEAIDLSNGAALAALLDRGAAALLKRPRDSAEDLVRWLYVSALCRQPSPDELRVAVAILGEQPTEKGAADLLWAVFMLPEFQTVR